MRGRGREAREKKIRTGEREDQNKEKQEECTTSIGQIAYI